MNRKTKTLLAVSLLFCCWKADTTTQIRNAGWLIGTWENRISAEKSIYETWTKIRDDAFSGKSYMLRNKDTLVFETVSLLQKQEQLFYIATVRNQNKAVPVSFLLKKSTDRELVFENPLHDFPQVIRYSRIGTDSLIAEISGIKNGKERKRVFPMRRIK